MDKFLDILNQTEIDSSRTNDLKGVNIFYILENLIYETLFPLNSILTKRQLKFFISALDKYLSLTLEKELEEEMPHLKCRENFFLKLKKEQWMAKLERKWANMSW